MKTGGRADGQAGRNWASRIAFLSIVVLGAPVVLPAQGSDADERAIVAYRLTDGVLAKYIQVSRAVVASGLQRETEAADDEENEKDPTIDEIAAMYDKHPATRRALAQAGLTSREFVVFTFALMQAGMAAWLVERHGWGQLPKEVARENVLFYQRHKARLDSLTQQLKQQNEREP